MSETHSARFLAMALGGLAIIGLSVEALSRSVSTPAIPAVCIELRDERVGLYNELSDAQAKAEYGLAQLKRNLEDEWDFTNVIRHAELESQHEARMEWLNVMNSRLIINGNRMQSQCSEEFVEEAYAMASGNPSL